MRISFHDRLCYLNMTMLSILASMDENERDCLLIDIHEGKELSLCQEIIPEKHAAPQTLSHLCLLVYMQMYKGTEP